MKHLLNFFNKKKIGKATPAPMKREELEKKAIEGAEKVGREYRGVFERLAEYDRTGKSELIEWTDKFIKRYRGALEVLAKQ